MSLISHLISHLTSQLPSFVSHGEPLRDTRTLPSLISNADTPQGMGLEEDFTLTATLWADDPEDMPLLYRFGYSKDGQVIARLLIRHAPHGIRSPTSVRVCL